MKFLLVLILLFSNVALNAQAEVDSIRSILDTCTSNKNLRITTARISRSNAFRDVEISHIALRLAKERIFKTTDSTTQGDIYQEHGILHAIRFEHDSAVHFFLKAIDQYSQHDSTDIGFAYRNLCASERMLEDMDKSLEYGYMALRFLPLSDSLYLPLTYLELSKVLYTLQHHPLSEEYAQRAVPYFEASGDLYNIAASYNTMGLAQMNQEKFAESLVSLHKANQTHLMRGDSVSGMQTYINIGTAFIESGQYDSAYYYLRSAEESPYTEASPIPTTMPSLYANLGYALFYMERYDEALHYAQMAYDEAETKEINYILERAAKTLNLFYLQKGDTVKAHEYLTVYHRAYEQNNNLSNTMLFNTLEEAAKEKLRLRQYEFNQAQLEDAKRKSDLKVRYLFISLGVFLVLSLILLQLYRLVVKRRRETAAINSRLNQLDEAKNRLFAIIGHDLRGPIGNSLYLLKEMPQRGDKLSADSQEILDNVNQGLTEVHGLLENLLVWSKDQATDLNLRLEEVVLSELAWQCVQIMSPLLQQKRMKIELDVDKELKWDLDAQAYSTVLRNLVSNSLKYSPASSKVTINIQTEGNELVTRICDEGGGIPAEVMQNLKNSSSFKHSTTKGMGLYLVCLLVELHDGTIDFQNHPGNSCVEIRIPASDSSH